jgi:hypothetical protein
MWCANSGADDVSDAVYVFISHKNKHTEELSATISNANLPEDECTNFLQNFVL